MDFLVNVNKIIDLAKEQGKKITHLCSLVGKQRGWLKDIKIKNLDISDENLIKIADELNTTVEYLRDETDKKEKPLQTQELPEKAKLFIELFEKVPEERQELVIQLLQSLQSSEDKE